MPLYPYFCFSFAKGCRPGYQTGFDIDDADLRELEQFHGVIVASAIFGTSIKQPFNPELSLSYEIITQICYHSPPLMPWVHLYLLCYSGLLELLFFL